MLYFKFGHVHDLSKKEARTLPALFVRFGSQFRRDTFGNAVHRMWIDPCLCKEFVLVGDLMCLLYL